MKTDEFIKERISKYYWEDDVNCATTQLKILAEVFEIELNEQIVNAATGMHGAGAYGAQCGLVEGTLMFLGIFGKANNMPENIVVQSCKEFAAHFEGEFKSLLCSTLRPEGFHADNPPHLCEPLTRKGVQFSISFISNLKSEAL